MALTAGVFIDDLCLDRSRKFRPAGEGFMLTGKDVVECRDRWHGESYDKVFNHHAPLEGKCGGMAWKFKGNLKFRGSLFHSWKIRFEDVYVLKVKIATMDHLGISSVFVLSSSNRGRNVGIKRLLEDLRVITVKLMLLVYKLLLLVFRVNAASTKLQLLKDYNC
ncbi:hypothetical protein Tco_0865887 [Tanacetum coccineum]